MKHPPEQTSTTTSDAETLPWQFTEKDAEALMKILMEREASSETEKNSNDNDNSPLVYSSPLGLYMTLQGLVEQFVKRVETLGGRCKTEEGAQFLDVSVLVLEQAMTNVQPPVLYPIYAPASEHVLEYVSEAYLDKVVLYLQEKLQQCDTWAVSEALHSLPRATPGSNPARWLELLETRLARHKILVRDTEMGARVFVRSAYVKQFCLEVYQTLAHATGKVSLVVLCQEHSWDLGWVQEALLHPRSDQQHLLPPGEVQGRDFYVPHEFKERQHKLIVDDFQSQGFVSTQTLASKADISPTQLIRQLQQEFGSDVVVLDNHAAVVSHERIVAPWRALLDEADASQSWCEFSVTLDLLSACDDTSILRQQLLEACLFDSDSIDSHGVLGVSSEGHVIYLSVSMLQNLNQHYVSLALSSYATEKVQTLISEASSKDIDIPRILQEEEETTTPPLGVFLQMVQSHYPDLSSDESYPTHQQGATAEQTALADICQRIFVESEEIQQKSKEYLQKELEKISRQRSGGAVHVSETRATPEDEILLSFEDPLCFNHACFRLQSLVRFYEYAVKHEMESVSLLEQEIRLGCCMDFTRRIHQFCLSQHPDLVPFTFLFRNGSDSQQRLPNYCSAIDLASASLGPHVKVACSPDPETGQERDPFLALPQLLPGGVGQALKEQYMLCKKEGSLRDVLAHVEEHTLTICGLPFKKLDKKSEKQFLAARKLELVRKLERATTPQQVLEYTVMILYQFAKNQCVAGSLLNGPILSLLVQERKIPQPVGECLVRLSTQLLGNSTLQPPDKRLVESVRGCGLSKDISKHSIAT